MKDLLAAEVLKLRTTKTMWALLGATISLTVLAVVGAVAVASDQTDLDLESARGVRMVLHVSASGAIFVLVLGIIIAAGEYRQRTATDTFLTTPDRRRVVLAKLIVGAGAGIVFGALAAGAAIAVAAHAYGFKGYEFPLGSGGGWSILGGAVLYAALFGALGAATGSLVRDQVGSIVGWLAWLFVAENIVLGIASGVGRWLPAAAVRALVRDPNGDFLSQRTGAAVLATYVAVVAVLAVFVERHRDA